MKKTAAGLSIAVLAVVGAILAKPTMPAWEAGPRDVTLTIVVDADKEATAWPAWALAWCQDGDTACIEANAGPQGQPLCDRAGKLAGYLGRTRATRSQAERAAFTMRGMGQVVEGDGESLLAALDWAVCPE